MIPKATRYVYGRTRCPECHGHATAARTVDRIRYMVCDDCDHHFKAIGGTDPCDEIESTPATCAN